MIKVLPRAAVFVALLVGRCTLANEWNEENIEESLKEWLDVTSIEKTWQSPLLDGLENEETCYTEKDIAGIYQFAKTAKIDENDIESRAPLSNLDKSSGQLIFKDKRRLEASDFKKGLASGFGKITFHSHHYASNDSFLSGYFQNGCLQGLVKGYEFLPLDGIENDPSFDEPVVNSVAFYENGRPVGPSWRIVFSPDGIILGYFFAEQHNERTNPNFDLDITAQDAIFIYPDMATAIKGRFDKRGALIKGHLGQIKGERTTINGLKEVNFERTSNQELKADISSKTHLCSRPLYRDPYEAKLVDVRKSQIEKAGDGVFLIKNVPANTTVAYFNGVRLRKNDVFSWNPFQKPSVYLVGLSDEKGEDLFLDIPAQYSKWESYKASAGHKVNHSKTPNSAYTECDHPIFGKILCLYVTEDLPAETELLTQYEVSMDKDGMKSVLKTALEIGHRYSGKSRKDFAREVRPYLQLASQFAEKINVESLLSF